ncbi:hypothetical protein C1646_765061 [Rhizophagus diaphanus]|nr:hypothetical protein C1646_765061 [Rhizophagus diaphanus] [Rhizophagus sp. MUCL 43196]
MAYVECKIWPSSIGLYDYDIRDRVINEGRIPHYITKALIDTTSTANFIKKGVLDKLGIKYKIHHKDSPFYKPNVLGYTNLELSFRYKGEDRLVYGSDDTDFEVVEEPKADLDPNTGEFLSEQSSRRYKVKKWVLEIGWKPL